MKPHAFSITGERVPGLPHKVYAYANSPFRSYSLLLGLCLNKTYSVVAKGRCSWQGIDRSLVASARAVKIY